MPRGRLVLTAAPPHVLKLLVADAAVAVLVHLPDHVLHLRLRAGQGAASGLRPCSGLHEACGGVTLTPAPARLLDLVAHGGEVGPQLCLADQAIVVGVQDLEGGAQLLLLIPARKALLRRRRRWQRRQRRRRLGPAGGACARSAPRSAPNSRTRDSSVAMACLTRPGRESGGGTLRGLASSMGASVREFQLSQGHDEKCRRQAAQGSHLHRRKPSGGGKSHRTLHRISAPRQILTIWNVMHKPSKGGPRQGMCRPTTGVAPRSSVPSPLPGPARVCVAATLKALGPCSQGHLHWYTHGGSTTHDAPTHWHLQARLGKLGGVELGEARR